MKEYVIAILGEMLPHIFDICDWAQEIPGQKQIPILRDVCAIFVIAIRCSRKEVSTAIKKLVLYKMIFCQKFMLT